MTVHVLPAAQAGLATALLCEVFAEYPVMRYVLGSAGDYAKRLHTLIGFFVAARVMREDLILGAFDPSRQLAGVALVTLPGDREPPASLLQRREAVWQELGSAERAVTNAYYVHRLAADHPQSAGVSLSTETRANLPLYEHFGYQPLGSARVRPELETWAFYRPNPGTGGLTIL